MTTKGAMAQLIKELRTDKNYYEAWQANIATSYIDNELWYKKETGKTYLSRKDKHKIANKSAKYFLDLLIKQQ